MDEFIKMLSQGAKYKPPKKVKVLEAGNDPSAEAEASFNQGQDQNPAGGDEGPEMPEFDDSMGEDGMGEGGDDYGGGGGGFSGGTGEEIVIEDPLKQKYLLRDMQTLYVFLDTNIEVLSDQSSPDIVINKIVNKVIDNFNKAKTLLYDYMTTVFVTRTYAENLLIYEYFKKGVYANLEILSKVQKVNENNKASE